MKDFIKNVSIFSRVSNIITMYPHNLRRRILRNAILGIVSLLAVFVGYEILRYQAVKRNISLARIDQIQEQIERTFHLVIRQSVEESLSRIQEFGQGKKIELTDRSSLDLSALFVLSKLPFISSLQIANDQGTEHLIYGDRITWQTRLIREGEPAEWKRWKGGTTAIDEWEEEIEYDPRSQVWYQRAVASPQSDVSWNIMSSLMPVRGLPGISGARHWEFSGTLYVAVLNIHLEEILQLMAMFSGNDHGSIFWLTDDGETFSSSGMKRPIKTNIQESLFSSATDPIAEAAIEDFVEQWKTRDSSAVDFFYADTVENTPWWTEARKFTVDKQTFWLGATVPEQVLLPQIERRQKTILSQIISTIILVVALVAILLRFIVQTSEEIKAQQEDIDSGEGKLRDLIQGGEGRKLEFKSTLRWNLKTNKPGKEIEIAWLKTVAAYLNSGGGRILIGVRDDGDILGLATDNFKNDDKLLLHVNNLLKQHIGLEFSQFVTVELQPIDDKQVLLIYCETAKTPVFLKHNNDEQFYIRTGPSSIKLSGSEMLKYLEHRS